MQERKTVLTTGDVARICNVAPRTVSKWVDTGRLRGYRIPGGKDRRIPLDQLIRFMKSHGLPLNGLESGRTRILIVDADLAWCETIREVLESQRGFEVMAASASLEAGAACASFKPRVMVVDLDLPGADPTTLMRFCQCQPDLADTAVIAMGRYLSNSQGEGLIEHGFSGWLSKPFEMAALVQRIIDGERFADERLASTP